MPDTGIRPVLGWESVSEQRVNNGSTFGLRFTVRGLRESETGGWPADDRALTFPDAGISAWREQWLGSDSDTGREHHAPAALHRCCARQPSWNQSAGRADTVGARPGACC